MSEAPVNIVKLAVGVQSVEELVLIQKRFMNQPGAQTSKGFYHSTKLMPKKHEAIVEDGITILGNKGGHLCKAKNS